MNDQNNQKDDGSDIDLSTMNDATTQSGGNNADQGGNNSDQGGDPEEEIDYDGLVRGNGLMDQGSQAGKPNGGASKAPVKGKDQDKGGNTNTDQQAPAGLSITPGDLQQWWQAQGLPGKPPAALKKEQLFDVLAQAVLDRDHPELKLFRAALAQGVEPAQYMQSYGAIDQQIALGDKDLLRSALQAKYGKSEKNPGGWDETRLNSVIEGIEKNPADLALRAEEIRGWRAGPICRSSRTRRWRTTASRCWR